MGKEILVDNNSFGYEFEEEVKVFLNDVLKFSDVKGGHDFHIAPKGQTNQIDVCGRFGNILFAFECKAAGRRLKKDLRKDILATATKAKIAFENYRNIPEYKKCIAFRFVFITKKIEVSDVNRDLCKNTHMYYEDESMLEYYNELYEKVGQYAVYNFLSDFGIYPPDQEKLRVLATRASIGGHKIYSFFARPKELLKFSYVARRRFGKENFYQRMLDASRIKKIQKFVDRGGVFPTNIVLSLRQGQKDFEKLSQPIEGQDVGFLTISKSYSACWIVDGQHRLYSFAQSNSDALIPCVAFDDITIDKERGFFLEINREQKPIQPDLLWDLEGLSNPNSYRGIISNIVHSLNLDEKGPFFYKIYIPLYGSKTDKIVNMAAFCNGIENALLVKEITPNTIGTASPLTAGEPWTVTKRIARVLSSYFLSLQDDLSEDSKNFVFGNAGIPVMLYLFEPIAAYIGKIPNLSELEVYTQLIATFFKDHFSSASDFKRLRNETNSEGARKNLARQMGIYIRRAIKDPLFWPKMEQDEFLESIKIMERRIASFVSSELSKINTMWERQRVPSLIYSKTKERMEVEGTSFDENLGLGDVATIIFQKNNWDEIFESRFIRKEGFVNKNELEVAFMRISKIRNAEAHGRSVVHNKEDLDQCELYLNRFSKIIPERILESEVS